MNDRNVFSPIDTDAQANLGADLPVEVTGEVDTAPPSDSNKEAGAAGPPPAASPGVHGGRENGAAKAPWASGLEAVLTSRITLLAAVIGAILAAIQIYDYLGKERGPGPGLHVSTDLHSLAPLPGGVSLVSDGGARLFSVGLSLRLSLILDTGSAPVIVNAISIETTSDMQPDVLEAIREIKASGGDKERHSWAGTRVVDAYYGVIDPDRIRVVHNRGDGVVRDCDPNNILSCGGMTNAIHLAPAGSTGHSVDLKLKYSGDSPIGLLVRVSYSTQSSSREARAEHFVLFN